VCPKEVTTQKEGFMKHIFTMFIGAALLLSPAVKGQQTTQPAASTPQVQSPATRSVEDDPDFQKLSPEMQQKVRQFDQMLKEAIANEKKASAPSIYTYPTPQTQPGAKAVAESTCVVVPKKKGWRAAVKQHLESMAKAQAARVDAQIGKDTKGTVDPGVQDTTASAINDANQSQPCTQAKPAKQ
jgi:hypothetical protein